LTVVLCTGQRLAWNCVCFCAPPASWLGPVLVRFYVMAQVLCFSLWAGAMHLCVLNLFADTGMLGVTSQTSPVGAGPFLTSSRHWWPNFRIHAPEFHQSPRAALLRGFPARFRSPALFGLGPRAFCLWPPLPVPAVLGPGSVLRLASPAGFGVRRVLLALACTFVLPHVCGLAVRGT